MSRTTEMTVPKLINIVKQDGLANLYKGYWVTLMTFGPFSAIYFLVYEKTKKLLQTSKSKLNFVDYLLAASVSSAIASSITTPFDVVKTRFQVQRRTQGIDSEMYKSVFDGFSKIIKQEGYAALWKGLSARVAYNAPNSAIIMTSCMFFFVLTKIRRSFETVLCQRVNVQF